MEDLKFTPASYDRNSEPMSVGDWLKTLLLMMIPFVNIVLMFVWAFGSDVNISKRNYFKANLILLGIVFGIYILIFIFVIVIAALGSI